MTGEEQETRIKRLLYQSWYRGCKETDRVLGQFAKQHLVECDAADLEVFEQLLEESDNDIWRWISGQEEIPERYKDTKLMAKLLAFDFATSEY